ncbi:MAG: cysteine desulfurase family protein [Myxococcota bacterium]
MMYLDHNATTPMRSAALRALIEAAGEAGNPSSVHSFGRRAQNRLEDARDSVRQLVGTAAADVVFTSGGTEAILLFILAMARQRRQTSGAQRILLSGIEHPVVLEAARTLAEEGFTREFMAVKPEGRICVDTAQFAPSVALACLMLANNETGAVQPVAEFSTKAHAALVPVFCDAVQGAGKVPLKFDDWDLDGLAISAHKFGGPRGIGALVVRKGLSLEHLWGGGGQEGGQRPGTQAVALACGMGAAACEAVVDVAARDVLASQRDRLQASLMELGDVRVFAAEGARLPNTLSIAFAGVSATALAGRLEAEQIMVGQGAACHSGAGGSSTLAAMGLEPQWARSVVRLSLGMRMTPADLDIATAKICQAVRDLRRVGS